MPFHSPSSRSVFTTLRTTVTIPTRPTLVEERPGEKNASVSVCVCVFKRMHAGRLTHPGCTPPCKVCKRVLMRSRGWKSRVEQVPLKEPHMKALIAGWALEGRQKEWIKGETQHIKRKIKKNNDLIYCIIIATSIMNHNVLKCIFLGGMLQIMDCFFQQLAPDEHKVNNLLQVKQPL